MPDHPQRLRDRPHDPEVGARADDDAAPGGAQLAHLFGQQPGRLAGPHPRRHVVRADDDQRHLRSVPHGRVDLRHQITGGRPADGVGREPHRPSGLLRQRLGQQNARHLRGMRHTDTHRHRVAEHRQPHRIAAVVEVHAVRCGPEVLQHADGRPGTSALLGEQSDQRAREASEGRGGHRHRPQRSQSDHPHHPFPPNRRYRCSNQPPQPLELRFVPLSRRVGAGE